MLSKLSVSGRPTSLDESRARAYCTCSRSGRGCLDIFSLICIFSFLSLSLWETARYRLKYCLKGPSNPKQPTNQLGKTAMNYWVRKFRNDWPARLPKEFILDGINFIITNNKHYRQTKVTAMGTKFAPVYAALVIGYREEILNDEINIKL